MYDLYDIGAVFGQEPGRGGTAHTLGQVEYPQSSEDAFGRTQYLILCHVQQSPFRWQQSILPLGAEAIG
jgi:hypothetical protein